MTGRLVTPTDFVLEPGALVVNQLVLVAAIAIAQAEPRPGTPAESFAQAHADLSSLPPADRAGVRYLSLYNVPPADRPRAFQVMSGHCNGLSRSSDIVQPTPIKGTAGALLRVNLLDYKWDSATWDKLLDPFFTTTIETTIEQPWPGGVWKDDGRFYQAGAFRFKRQVKTPALAPWLTENEDARQKLADVVAWTGSKAPIVRADWFFNQTAAAVDRSPNYYDFLGVTDEASFQKMIGADPKAAEAIGADLREAIAISGVTLHARALARHPTLAGAYWRSFDFLTKTTASPLRVLGRDVEKQYDASEQFAHLPNGFWATGLFDKGGKVQATAPDGIASDSMSSSNDRRVHVNVSCIRCHSNGGMQDIAGWVRNLLAPPLEMRSPDQEKARELRRQYARKLEPALEKDRQIFEAAVQEATGLTAKKYAAAYAEFWEKYEDARIDLATAAADLGVGEKRFRDALSEKIKAGAGDTVLSALLLPDPRLNKISVRDWEQSFAEANLIIRGYR